LPVDVPLAVALAGDARAWRELTPDQRVAALAQRRRLGRAWGGGPFDPRRRLTLSGAALVAWQAEREAWAAGVCEWL
jgi:hypothetical protein